MSLELERIAVLAERLHLPQLTGVVPALAEGAAKREASYQDFLLRVLEAEAQAADLRAHETLLKLASFPYRRSLDDFDFAFQPSVKARQVRELASCAFVERAENVLLLGPPGVGKTHLAVALGLAAIQRRLKVKFTTAADMVGSLAHALRQGTYARRLLVYTRPSLLIIDEIGFLPLDPAQAGLLFQVVCQRYERGSIVLTSNKSYGEWAEIFSGDAVIASAILDRLLHHSTTISIRGESYRLREKRKAGLVNEGKEAPED